MDSSGAGLVGRSVGVAHDIADKRVQHTADTSRVAGNKIDRAKGRPNDAGMNHKFTLRVAMLVALVTVGLCIYSYSLVKFEREKYDDARLLAFARQIGNADRIVMTTSLGPVHLMIAGEDVKKVVRAVSSSRSDRPPSGSKWKCDYNVKAVFFQGTNEVGEVRMCSNVFLIPPDQSPFRDETGLLKTIVYEPTLVAYFKEGEVK